MVTKEELKQIEDELNHYLKQKYPNLTFIEDDNDTYRYGPCPVSVKWEGDSGIKDINQAIGYLKCMIDQNFPKEHVDEMSTIMIFDDTDFMKEFPDTKSVYGFNSLLPSGEEV